VIATDTPDEKEQLLPDGIQDIFNDLDREPTPAEHVMFAVILCGLVAIPVMLLILLGLLLYIYISRKRKHND